MPRGSHVYNSHSDDPHETTGLNPAYISTCVLCGYYTYPGLVHGCPAGVKQTIVVLNQTAVKLEAK